MGASGSCQMCLGLRSRNHQPTQHRRRPKQCKLNPKPCAGAPESPETPKGIFRDIGVSGSNLQARIPTPKLGSLNPELRPKSCDCTKYQALRVGLALPARPCIGRARGACKCSQTVVAHNVPGCMLDYADYATRCSASACFSTFHNLLYIAL